jgi:branched-subunit amino acid transport protein
MNLWLIMLASGLLTFLTRLSFIILLEKVKLPPAFERALRLVPIAALSAIIAPQLAYYQDSLFISPANPRLLAGIFASLVAYLTKNVIATIVAGMAAFWLLEFLLKNHLFGG